MTPAGGPVARARGAARRWRDAHLRPSVTVVVPVFQAEPYLDECLTSLRAQTHERLQIVVVDDGSTDGSNAVYSRHAAADKRIEVVRQANHGLGAARNVGIARARGDYLTFLDADDSLPPRAYERMVDCLEESRSDFVTGGVLRVASGRRSTPSWIREVHASERRGISIDDFPRAVMDVIACNRMFRTSSWRSLGLAFPEGVAYEDHVPMMAAYVRGRFDVLAETTYLWRIREDRTSIGQQKHTVSNLRDRLEAKRAARAVLEAEASPVVLATWQARVLDMDLRLFIDEVPAVDDEYWSVLRDGVREHVERATPEVWADVRVEQRLRAWLVAHDHRPEVETLVRRAAEGERVVSGRVEGSAVVVRADLPHEVEPPAWLLEAGERELELTVALRALQLEGATAVLLLAPKVGPVVDGLADAVLTGVVTAADGTATSIVADAAAADTWHARGTTLSGVELPDLRVLRVPLASLPEVGDPWHVSVEYAVGGRTWSRRITSRDPEGSAGRLPLVAVGDRTLRLHWRARGGLAIEVVDPLQVDARVARLGEPSGRPLLVVHDATVAIDGLELVGTWRGTPARGPARLVGDFGAEIPVVVSDDAGTVRLTASWGVLPEPGVWRLRLPGSSTLAWVSAELLDRLPITVHDDADGLGVIRDTDDAPALRVALRRR